MSKQKPWTRAPEAQRCTATMLVLGLQHVRCDHAAGHDGLHQYMSMAGAIVSFSYVEVADDGAEHDLTLPAEERRR